MANGLFATRNIGTPGEIQRLMQLEQEKRIRDAGAGFSNPLVRARAMAGQGMQEAISGIGTGLTGLLGGQIRLDPRMQEAVKRDRVRTTMMQKYKDAAADGDVTYEERMAIAADLDAAGFPNEAERARASARAIREEQRKEELYPTKKSLLEAQASYYSSKGTALPKFKSYTKEQIKTLQAALKANDKALAKFKLMFPNDWINMLEGPEKENVMQFAEVISRVDQKNQYRLGPIAALNAWTSGETPGVSSTPGKKGKGTVYKQKPKVTGQQISGGSGAGAATPPPPAAANPSANVNTNLMFSAVPPSHIYPTPTSFSQAMQPLMGTRTGPLSGSQPRPARPAPQPSAPVVAAPVAAPAGTIRPAVQGQSMAIPPATTAALPPSPASVAPPAPAVAPPGTIRPATPGQSMAIPPKDTPDIPDAFTLPDQDRKVFARIESSGKPTAVNGKSIGLYQFKYETAKELMPGIKKKDLLKPDIQEELLDRYIRKNAKQLGTTDPYELYMAHQQGVQGYKELLNMRDVKIKDIRDPARKRNVMNNRRPETKADKNATVGDFLDEWKRHYYKLRKDL